MEAKHTRGPWDICCDGNVLHPVSHAGMRTVAFECPDYGRFGEWLDESNEEEANTRLIAAAPDLLAALCLYVRLDNDRRAGCKIEADDWGECHQAATTAIAKAKGNA